MMNYKTCEKCGASLDFGETCNCQEKTEKEAFFELLDSFKETEQKKPEPVKEKSEIEKMFLRLGGIEC